MVKKFVFTMRAYRWFLTRLCRDYPQILNCVSEIGTYNTGEVELFNRVEMGGLQQRLLRLEAEMRRLGGDPTWIEIGPNVDGVRNYSEFEAAARQRLVILEREVSRHGGDPKNGGSG
jgi:hypothetical protein